VHDLGRWPLYGFYACKNGMTLIQLQDLLVQPGFDGRIWNGKVGCQVCCGDGDWGVQQCYSAWMFEFLTRLDLGYGYPQIMCLVRLGRTKQTALIIIENGIPLYLTLAMPGDLAFYETVMAFIQFSESLGA